MFLDVNVPSMLAPENLPAFAAGIDCEYLVYTTPKDGLAILRSAAFQRLQGLVSVSMRLFTPTNTKNPVGLHHDIWRAATEHARRTRAFILLMPPDVAWANGSFAQLRKSMERGKRAIFMTYPRVVSETIVPALHEGFSRAADEAMVVSPAELTALAVTHMHPLMAAYSRSGGHFPMHSEFVLWPVPDDGFLLRLLARELFCFEAGRYPLNAQALLDRMPPTDEIHVFHDSREFLGVSFTPLWKDMEWYLRRNRLDPLAAGRWWITYDSPANDYISSFDLRFTTGSVDEAGWRRVGRQADALLTHLRAAREFVRVVMTLQDMEHARAAAFLATALRLQGLARRWPHRGPFLMLAPTDAAFEAAGLKGVPGNGIGAPQARRLIEAHVVALPAGIRLEDGLELATLQGDRFRLAKTRLVQPCWPHFVLPVDKMLPTASQYPV